MRREGCSVFTILYNILKSNVRNKKNKKKELIQNVPPTVSHIFNITKVKEEKKKSYTKKYNRPPSAKVSVCVKLCTFYI